MPTMTFAVSGELKQKMKSLPWVNWSEVAREEAEAELDRLAALDRALEIVSKSRLTKAGAGELGAKAKESMRRKDGNRH